MSNSPTWDQIKGAWKQISGKIREEWGEFTDDEIMEMNGERDQLVGKIQQKYGMAREDAQREVDNWSRRVRW
ncbi:MAG: CsbD family protein [Anaerolineae bacterium]|jgi:uncharacterized protein YjbJ (UPF0337 family)|nr:CsbD family protein [Chloroflexota bacterium]MBN8634787.1 CsbD family protein [Anaerolineae bacterium]